ncbi:MAG: T9SS type A sorting domain-containing protein [Saprospiraceae bacterium]
MAPNPMFESTRIELKGEHLLGKEFDFHLFNMAGQPVSISKVRGTKFYFSRNGLPSGMYFFRISQRGGLWHPGRLLCSNS